MRIVTVAFACLGTLIASYFRSVNSFLSPQSSKKLQGFTQKKSTRFPEEIKRVKCLNFRVKLWLHSVYQSTKKSGEFCNQISQYRHKSSPRFTPNFANSSEESAEFLICQSLLFNLGRSLTEQSKKRIPTH